MIPDEPRVLITETVLRDAHQSLFATRMSTDDMVGALEALDSVGYWSLEVWGGATFDAAIRFLTENPWERLRRIRAGVKKTKLQMLLRGRNIVGYRHYPSDVLVRFVELAAENGIDVFRIFDALNDIDNIAPAIEAVKRTNRIAEAAISYTTSPVHTLDSFVRLAKDFANAGADLICIKDMAGLLKPYTAYELVSALLSEVRLPVHLHAHATSGMAEMTYLKAVEAGARIIDCAISPFAGGTSQPPTESLVAALSDTEYSTGLSLSRLQKVAAHFSEVRKRLEESVGFPSSAVNTAVLRYQIPGGMMSNLTRQLREQNALHRLEDVLEEVPRVRADLGYPPLVTPTSQIVGIQATVNVLFNKRYATILEETKRLIRGEYGRTPAPVSEELKKKVTKAENKSETPNNNGVCSLAEARRVKGVENDEDAVTYALFPQNWRKYLESKRKVSCRKM